MSSCGCSSKRQRPVLSAGMPKFRRSPTNAKLPITCGGFVEIRRFLSFQIGGGWSAVPFLLPNNNAYCCTSTITANIMLNFDSGSLRLTAPRAAVTALYFFRLREFYTANAVFRQKYRLILAYISTAGCSKMRHPCSGRLSGEYCTEQHQIGRVLWCIGPPQRNALQGKK